MKHRKHRKIKKCLTTKKTRYNTQNQAQKGLMYVISHDPSTDMFDLHTYHCEYCGGWHFGHLSYFEKSQKQVDTVSV